MMLWNLASRTSPIVCLQILLPQTCPSIANHPSIEPFPISISIFNAKMKRYLLLNRHGHRAPAKNVFRGKDHSPAMAVEEDRRWESHMIDRKANANLDTHFPVQNIYEQTKDERTYPYGCLTICGKNHMKQVGARLADHFPQLKELDPANPGEIVCVATNYMRTQISAQALLSGLTSDSTFSTPKEGSKSGESESEKSEREKRENKGKSLKVVVRPVETCGMAFYDRSRGIAAPGVGLDENDEKVKKEEKPQMSLAQELVTAVQAKPSFQALEAGKEISAVRDVMAEELPHLVLASDSGPGPWKSSPPPAPSDTDTTTIGENSKNTEIKQSKEKEKEKDKDVVRFDYLAAFDYFLCRKAHNESIPSHLLERDLQCDEVVERHMVARYGEYFSDKRHMAHFVLPLLDDFISALDQSDARLTVFSGHDVNVLGLLFGLGLHSKEGVQAHYWPDYGATVLLEVCEKKGGKTDVAVYLDAHLQEKEDGKNVRPLARITLEQIKGLMEQHRLEL